VSCCLSFSSVLASYTAIEKQNAITKPAFFKQIAWVIVGCVVISLTTTMRLIRMSGIISEGYGRIYSTQLIFCVKCLRVRGMNNFLSEIRVRVLLMRILMGLLFAFLLARFFFTNAGILTPLALAGLLVFSAYVLEIIHKGKKPQ